MAIDRVFHLNERVSSALRCPRTCARRPPVGRCIADAIRKVADLDVAAEFGLRVPRRAWVVLIPADGGRALALRPGLVPRIARAKTTSPQIDTKAMAKQTEALTKKIASQRQAIDKEKFPEAEKLLAEIEKKADDLAKAPPAGQGQADGRAQLADRRPQGAAEAARLARAGQPAAQAAQGDGAARARPTSSPRTSRRATSRRPPNSSRSSRRSSRRAR